jgi:hypothetical protein
LVLLLLKILVMMIHQMSGLFLLPSLSLILENRCHGIFFVSKERY